MTTIMIIWACGVIIALVINMRTWSRDTAMVAETSKIMGVSHPVFAAWIMTLRLGLSSSITWPLSVLSLAASYFMGIHRKITPESAANLMMPQLDVSETDTAYCLKTGKKREK